MLKVEVLTFDLTYLKMFNSNIQNFDLIIQNYNLNTSEIWNVDWGTGGPIQRAQEVQCTCEYIKNEKSYFFFSMEWKNPAENKIGQGFLQSKTAQFHAFYSLADIWPIRNKRTLWILDIVCMSTCPSKRDLPRAQPRGKSKFHIKQMPCLSGPKPQGRGGIIQKQDNKKLEVIS